MHGVGKTLKLLSRNLQAEASLGMLKREYMHESLNYVLKIQDVQERIKFDFVEILLGFMSGEFVKTLKPCKN